MKNTKSYVFLLCLGIFICVTGFLLIIFFSVSDRDITPIPFIMIGSGASLSSSGISYIRRKKKFEKNPELAKQHEIAEKDERNIKLREKAAYTSWLITLFLLSFLSILLTTFDDKTAGLLVVAVMLIHIFSLPALIKFYNNKI